MKSRLTIEVRVDVAKVITAISGLLLTLHFICSHL